MKYAKLFIAAFLILLLSSNLYADASKFQVRSVIKGNEGEIQHESFPYATSTGEETVLVANGIILSVDDVRDASIQLQEDMLKEIPDSYWTIDSDGVKVLTYSKEDKLNLTAEPTIEFKLTETGRKKFEEFTKNNIGKEVAVIGNNQVLSKTMIMFPISGGKFQIFAPTGNVNEMARLVEGMGLKLKVKS